MGRFDHAKLIRLAAVLCAGASLAACASIQPTYPTAASVGTANGAAKIGQPYQVNGKWYVPKAQPDYDQIGVASWYGQAFHRKATANGEVFDMNAISAAHTTLPLPSIVEVTNLDNGKKIKVRVNDRGPFVNDRIIDLSWEAARELGYERAGLANVRVRYVGPAPSNAPGPVFRYAEPQPSYVDQLTREQTAFAANTKSTPAKVAPVKAGPPRVEFVSAPAPARLPVVASIAAPAPITGAELPALGPARKSEPMLTPVAQPLSRPTSGGLRIQAGAFSQQANAQRAVDQLSPAGLAVIEPMQRGAVTLYKVVMPAPADEAEAYALRDRVAAIGFADARVVKAF